MVILKSKILPFGKFKAMAFYPFIFYKGDYPKEETINHELIHFAQQKEQWIIGSYFTYVYQWFKYGYYNQLELEAYENDKNLEYLKTRKPFAWKDYNPDDDKYLNYKIYAKKIGRR